MLDSKASAVDFTFAVRIFSSLPINHRFIFQEWSFVVDHTWICINHILLNESSGLNLITDTFFFSNSIILMIIFIFSYSWQKRRERKSSFEKPIRDYKVAWQIYKNLQINFFSMFFSRLETTAFDRINVKEEGKLSCWDKKNKMLWNVNYVFCLFRLFTECDPEQGHSPRHFINP